ncbi:MAG: acetyl-CoA carboxylase biotin carboxylase subunit [Deltaproteobacteria bacterium]|jgi:acetyl-CoA carboxylase biotin carboxylase subunit|nr:acetyl-CoA carboxylase biotin carboxylase subunit [Deltaproteobacteria bacterium]MBW2496340.1 acetyl-CoA carboxylase biotin carboxylase subunit [Deltaproteobacteria bacterium]
MFGRVLIANRGEIAVRVIRACRRLGLHSIAIYSEADRDALHVRLADEAHPCGPARATESYLDRARVVDLAKRVGAEAVHPGYGFLSENAQFAEAVTAAGLVFVGPSPDVMRTMGLKVESREQMIRAGVPVVPGGDAIESLEGAREAAAALGYPVLVKASAGGGGRGMRLVEDESELESALERGRSEAESAFGDGSIYLEKYLLSPRHIEIQILADGHGNVIHLGERECSIQRRHQKLVEEAPAFGLDESLRETMGEAAVRAARSVDYVGAGTCEFLLDARGDFYFLEMNTRIQVEHPVTEAVTGIDLVEMQLRIAAGERLPFAQSDIALRGHAIEARIYAEDPDKGFVPSPGRIEAFSAPGGPGIRLDSGFEAGQIVSSHYDPMIAKLIARGHDREEARGRLAAALEEFQIAGLRTGLPFLRRLVDHPVFRAGAYDTGFIDERMGDGPDALEPALRERVFALVGLAAAQAEEAADDGSLRFEIALPKEPAALVEVVSAQRPFEIRVDERSVVLDLSGEDGVVLTLLGAGEVVRLSLVAKKKGIYEVGLRDRLLRVKCEAIQED